MKEAAASSLASRLAVMAAIGADFPPVTGLAWLGLARIAASSPCNLAWAPHHTREHRAQIQPARNSQSISEIITTNQGLNKGTKCTQSAQVMSVRMTGCKGVFSGHCPFSTMKGTFFQRWQLIRVEKFYTTCFPAAFIYQKLVKQWV